MRIFYWVIFTIPVTYKIKIITLLQCCKNQKIYVTLFFNVTKSIFQSYNIDQIILKQQNSDLSLKNLKKIIALQIINLLNFCRIYPE